MSIVTIVNKCVVKNHNLSVAIQTQSCCRILTFIGIRISCSHLTIKHLCIVAYHNKIVMLVLYRKTMTAYACNHCWVNVLKNHNLVVAFQLQPWAVFLHSAIRLFAPIHDNHNSALLLIICSVVKHVAVLLHWFLLDCVASISQYTHWSIVTLS